MRIIQLVGKNLQITEKPAYLAPDLSIINKERLAALYAKARHCYCAGIDKEDLLKKRLSLKIYFFLFAKLKSLFYLFVIANAFQISIKTCFLICAPCRSVSFV